MKDKLEVQIEKCSLFLIKFENLLSQLKTHEIKITQGIDLYYKFLDETLEYIQKNYTVSKHWNLECAFRGHIIRDHWKFEKENYSINELSYQISEIVYNFANFLKDLKKERELSYANKKNIMESNKTFVEISALILKDIENEFLKTKETNYEMWNYENKFGFKINTISLAKVTDHLIQKGYLTQVYGREDGLFMVELTNKAIIDFEKSEDTIRSLNLENTKSNTTINVQGSVYNSQLNANSSNNVQINYSNDIEKILDEIINVVKVSNEINTTERKDLIADIAIIKYEISKSKPNKTWLTEKIQFLNNYSFLIQYVPAILESIKHI